MIDIVSAQNTLIVKDAEKIRHITQEIDYLEDKKGNIDIKEVLSPTQQKQFKSFDKKLFTVPATTSTFWFRIVLENHSKEDLWLVIADALVWRADFFTPDKNGTYQLLQSLGSLRPQKNRTFESNFYCVKIAEAGQNNQKIYYIKISGEAPNNFLFQVASKNTLEKYFKQYEYTLYAFIGLIVGILIYNIFIFYSTKEKIYIYYLIYLSHTLFNIPFLNGNPLLYYNFFWDYFFVWHCPVFLITTLFAIAYLDLALVVPRLYRWLWIPTIILGVLFPISNILHIIPYYVLVNSYQVFLLIYAFSLLLSGVYVWFRGYQKARFFTMAWAFTIVSIFIYVATINGFLTFSPFTHQIMYAGFGLEALFFGLALGDKMNILKKETLAAQAENIKLIKDRNKDLKAEVKQRTAALQKSNEELQTMNEELSETQEILKVQHDYLDNQNNLLKDKNKQIENSIRAAQTIQQAVLPYTQKLDKLLKDYFVFYKPKDVVSGDFFWLNKVEEYTILIVLDCTGHGVPGAFMSLIANTLLDKIIRVWGITSPVNILKKLNQEVVLMLRQEHNKEMDSSSIGMDAAIVSWKHLDKEMVEVCFAGAKEPMYYILPTKEQLIEIKGSRKSIGGFQNPKTFFQEHKLILPKGTTIYLSSDGYADQNNPQRKKITSRKLKKLLFENVDKPMSEQKIWIEKYLKKHMQNVSQRDDMLLIGFKP